jgi:hypothetical protein
MAQLQQALKPQLLGKVFVDPRPLSLNLLCIWLSGTVSLKSFLRGNTQLELLSAIVSKKQPRENRVSPLEGLGIQLDGNYQNGIGESADFSIGIFYQNPSRFVA